MLLPPCEHGRRTSVTTRLRTALAILILGPAIELYREAQLWWPVVTASVLGRRT